MSECHRIQPLLARLADGEAEPAEALRAADHFRDCTSCRILFARERRLAELLDGGLDDALEVGEDFLQSVMERLPQGPPPRRDRRGLKIAIALGGIALAGAWLAEVMAGLRVVRPEVQGWRGLELPAGDALAELLAGAAGMLVALLQAVGAGLAPVTRWVPELPSLVPALAAPALILALTACAAATMAARQVLRSGVRTR